MPGNPALAMSLAATGVLAVAWLPALPPRGPWWLLFPLLLCLPKLPPALRIYGLCLMAGVGWGTMHGWSLLETRLPPALEGRELWVEGWIAGLPQPRRAWGRDGQRFDFVVEGAGCIEAPACEPALRRLRLSWYAGGPVAAGERWRLKVRLKRPHGSVNPVGFDYQRWLVAHGYDATGYVRDAEPGSGNNRRLAPSSPLSIGHWRQRLAWLLDQRLAEMPQRALLKALVLGERGGITPQQWELFAATGTSHLMVISGLHIGLVGGLVLWLAELVLRPWDRRFRHRQRLALAGALGLAAATLYSALAGFSLPTQRALLMFAVGVTALAAYRRPRPLTGMALALLLVALWDPLAALNAGFWLSFGAVAVIFYALAGRQRLGRAGPRWFTVQWAVTLGLIPLLAATVGQFSLLSLIANAVAIPVMSLVVVPGNLLALLLDPLAPGVSTLIWAVLDTLLGWGLAALQRLVHWGGELVLHRGAPSLAVLLLALAGAALLLAPRGLGGRPLGLILLLPMLVPAPAVQRPGQWQLTVLDVGQGLAAVVRTRNHTLVYDVGPDFQNGGGTVTSALLPLLRSQGIGRVDTLVLSHGDRDHVGYWEALPAALEVGAIYSGEPARVGGAARLCQGGQQWQWDGVRFGFLPRGSGSANNHSCVLRIDAPGFSALLPGDIEKSAESSLLTAGQPLAANVLLVPHHGSAGSSSWRFVQAVQADYAVFSAGYRNRFNHPHPDVVERYRRAGAEPLPTAATGALVFDNLDGHVTVRHRYRQDDTRYWR